MVRSPQHSLDHNIQSTSTDLASSAIPALALAGVAANQAAAQHVFQDFIGRKAAHTQRRYRGDLDLFKRFLAEAGVGAGDLLADPQAWAGVTWGLLAAFVQWQLDQGYAIGSINIRLSSVKTFCALALKAGVLDHATYTQIQTVKGFGQREGHNLDQQRMQTRVGDKKANPVSLTTAQARQLKAQPSDTPQGRRDALLMCLLLDYGLRESEISRLRVEHFDLERSTLTFYRPKVHITQTHALYPDTLAIARAYLETDAPDHGPLFRGSRKTKQLSRAKGRGGHARTRQSASTRPNDLSTVAIYKRVRLLGERIGIQQLSPHDCRHYWATNAAEGGTDLRSLQDAGGWSSPYMPMRYIESKEIANKGVKRGEGRQVD